MKLQETELKNIYKITLSANDYYKSTGGVRLRNGLSKVSIFGEKASSGGSFYCYDFVNHTTLSMSFSNDQNIEFEPIITGADTINNICKKLGTPDIDKILSMGSDIDMIELNGESENDIKFSKEELSKELIKVILQNEYLVNIVKTLRGETVEIESDSEPAADKLDVNSDYDGKFGLEFYKTAEGLRTQLSPKPTKNPRKFSTDLTGTSGTSAGSTDNYTWITLEEARKMYTTSKNSFMVSEDTIAPVPQQEEQNTSLDNLV